MTDPFAQATRQIFNSSIANDGLFLDSSENLIAIRCVVRDSLYLAGEGFTAQLPESRKAIDVLKDNFEYEIGNTITVSNITYSIDGILKDDGYAVTFSVVKL